MRAREAPITVETKPAGAAPRRRGPAEPPREGIEDEVSAFRERADGVSSASKTNPLEQEGVDALAEAVFERFVKKLDARARCRQHRRTQRRRQPRTTEKTAKIAVAGISRSVGTTHLATCLAFHLANKRPGQRVGLLLADKREFDAMTSGSALPREGRAPLSQGG